MTLRGWLNYRSRPDAGSTSATQFPARGGAKYTFPLSVAVNPSMGNVYAADFDYNRIKVSFLDP